MDIEIAEELANIAISAGIVDKDHRIFHEIEKALLRKVHQTTVKADKDVIKMAIIWHENKPELMSPSTKEMIEEGTITRINRDFSNPMRHLSQSLLEDDLKNGNPVSDSLWKVSTGYRK